MQTYQDSTLPAEERARDLLRDLTTDEKMAQLCCIFPFGESYTDIDRISEQAPHGMGQISTLEMRRIPTLAAVAEWQRAVQKSIMDRSPHHIPAVFHMEGLCGAFIQDSTSFPSGVARGSSWDPELERKVAETIARQELACGITQILAPVLDIARDPRMGRQGESYGEDPTLAAAMGSAYTAGIQSASVAGRHAESVAKHFLGFHAGSGGVHGAHSDIPSRALREQFAKPFQAAITEAGLRGIMPCYCSIDGEPLSASKAMLDSLLRGEMGFDGVVVSDYGGVGNVLIVNHVCESLEQAGLRCMEAGMDVELPNTLCFNDALRDMFDSGAADMAILDRAVLRVLTAKFRMGLFEHPFALEGSELFDIFARREDDELSLKAARESLILLKNDGILPLRSPKRLAVIGPHAIDAGSLFGGYTHLSMEQSAYAALSSIAGFEDTGIVGGEIVKRVPGTRIQSTESDEFESVLRRQQPDCMNLVDALVASLPDSEIVYARGYEIAGDYGGGFDDALERVRSADAAILTLGGKYSSCSIASTGEGVDSANINLPLGQELFIELAAKTGVPLIGVHLDGRPVSSDAADRYLSAIVEAWSPAECGAWAIAEALTGVCNPSGKLPVTVARNAGQLPIYYNHPNGSCWHQGMSIGFPDYVDLPHTPRYCFGHGLSYTEFEYGGLEVDRRAVLPDECVSISLSVKNVGGCAGTEIIQLYLSDRYASMTRPSRELAGFCRVKLKVGEEKRVCFTVDPSQLAFLDRDMNWKVEAGDIDVFVGSSSEDIRLRGDFEISDSVVIDGKMRKFFAKVAIK